MTLIYISNKFYNKHNSWATPGAVYTVEENRFARSDWNFVKFNLEEGVEVFLRPANEIEMRYFDITANAPQQG